MFLYRLKLPVWLLALVVVYSVTFSVLSILKHDNFHSFTFDLGIMSQVLWNTSMGRLFELSLDRPLNTPLIGSYFGNHVRPIMLLLVPLYRLWPDPRLLLVLQSVALGLGAVPLFWIARRELKNPAMQAALVVCYLLYPALGYINFFDFHPVAFTIPFLFVAYWALLEKRSALFWSMIVLTLATKEEMVVPVLAFGVYCLFKPRWRRKGLCLLALATLWAFLCFVVIIPYYNEGRSYRFFDLWAYLPPQLLARGGRDGGQISIANLFSAESVVFVVHLLLPLGFLPLLDPGLLAVSLPSLAYLLLGNLPALRSIGYQYPAVLIPWWFLAAVYGLVRVERWPRLKTRLEWLFLCLLVVGTLGMNLVLNPILFYVRNNAFSPTSHHEQVVAAMAQIPPDAGVATINPFGPHLANRRYLISVDRYPVPLPEGHMQHIDYVLLDLVDCRGEGMLGRAYYTDMVLQVVQSGEFRVRYWSDRILLLERGQPSQEELEAVTDYVTDLLEQNRPCWP
jgi:uncharacterized membrane protein